MIRNSGVPAVDDETTRNLRKVGSVPISVRTPEQRIKDQQDALNWLRHQGMNDKIIDPTGEFKKMNSLLPKKRGQSKSDRAKEIEQALDWCRYHGVDMADAVMTPFFEKVPSIGATGSTPDERAKDLQDALNWLRNKEKDESFGDPMGEFRKLDKLLPIKRGQTPEERAREIEGAIDWIRSKEANLAYDETDPSCIRARALEGCLDWCRNHEISPAKSDTLNNFL